MFVAVIDEEVVASHLDVDVGVFDGLTVDTFIVFDEGSVALFFEVVVDGA